MTPDPLPLVRISHLEGPVGFLTEVGAPVERLMSRSSLPSLALGDPDAFASSYLIYRFLELAALREGIADLGIRSALRVPVGEDPWTGPALRDATTLRDALEQLINLSRSESSQMHLAVRTTREGAWLEYRGSTPFGTEGADFAEHYMVTLLTRFVGRALGHSWHAQLVHLQAREPQALERFLVGTRFATGKGTTAIALPRPLLDRPVRRSPAAMAHPGPWTDPHGFVGGLRRALTPYLPEGLPGVRVAAEIAGTSVRSLQRRLGEAGLSYSQLTRQLRRETACRLIRDTDMRLTDVAFDLGFSDPAHFTRAFRNWVGTTPSAYRRESLEATSA